MPLSSEFCFFVKIVTTPLPRSESRLPRSETVQSSLHRGSPTHKSPPVVILYQISIVIMIMMIIIMTMIMIIMIIHNYDHDHDNQVRGSPSCRSRGSMQSTPGMSSRGNCCKVGLGVGIGIGIGMGIYLF